MEATMFQKRFFLPVVAIFAFVCLSGCGGSSKPVSVAVTATATTVDGTGTTTLTATVTNDKNSGGVTWTVSGGGALSGTTTSSATYTAPAATSSAQTVTVTATSVADTAKTGSVTITVPAQLASATTTAQLTGAVGLAYSQQLSVTGGISPYTWTTTLESGALPTGWSISTTGILSGPAAASGLAGSYAFTVGVRDSGTLSASLPLTLVINPATAITFTGTVSATATYGVAYTGSAAATGGAGTLTYTATGLPAWLTLSSTTGAISGTPTAVGASSFTVTAADAYGDSAAQAYTVTVSAATPVLSFAAISAKTYGDAAFTVSASSASSGAITYSVTSGPATISGNTVTLTGAGVVVLSASQAATTNYTAATATASFTVNPEPVTLSFASISTKVYGDAAFTVSASSASSGAITYSVTSGPATIDSSSGLVTLTGAGTVVLGASQEASGNYAAGTASASFTVNAALSITTASELPTGANGVAYSQTLQAAGGIGSYTWTLISDPSVLTPLGLSFNASNATLSGSTPVIGGPVSFTVQVADSASHQAQATLSITISSLSITTSALSPSWGLAGSSYSAVLEASGGSGSYSWSVTSGASDLSSLGLSLSSSGVLSGTSLVAGSASFTAKATDASSSALTATRNYSITVYPALALTPNPSPLSSFTSGQSYNETITVSGGSGSYASFQVNDSSGLQTVPSSGSLTLSSGFTLSMQNDNELIINGTPSITTALHLSVTVTDSLGNVITNTYTISPASNLAITLNDVPQGMVGMPYTFNGVSVSGGSGNYTVTFAGAPDGLANGTSGNNDANFLVGTPTASGTSTVTVTVTDSTTTQTANTSFSLPVVARTVAAHNSYLSGQYACSLQQYWNGGVTGGNGSTLYRGGTVFAFAADGSGNITGGEMDHSSPYSGYKSASTNGALGGTYAVGADNRGYLLATVGSSGSSDNSVIFALASGNLNSSSQFSEFAIVLMDDAGTNPSGQHGSGHCYKQNTTTSLSGLRPTGGYVVVFTGEDNSGKPESMVGSMQYTASTASTTGTVTGVIDMVDYLTTSFDQSIAGTTPAGSGTDAYGRTTVTAAPSGETLDATDTSVMYLTNNAKGQALIMGTQDHSTDGEFTIGEARKQVTANIAASYPLTGTGVMYTEGTNTENASGSTPTYEAQAVRFTGSSSAKTIILNSMIENSNGTLKKDSNDSIGQAMTYAVDTTTGRVTLTGQTGIYFYLYDTNSAAVIFGQVTSHSDGTSGTAVQNMTGWIEPQTAPTSGTWAVSNFASSYFMYRIENGNHEHDSQTSVLTLGSSGTMSGYASDDGGQNWASWDESMMGSSGTTATASVVLDTADGTYGLFDVNFTSGTTTTTESYCFAASVDAATASGAKGRLLCLDVNSNNPVINVIQE
jgi:large repetitive protein